MRWGAYKDGDRRIVKRFAWLPVQVENTFIWLERYKTHEQYLYRICGCSGHSQHLQWVIQAIEVPLENA